MPPPNPATPRLIVTADDFGASIEVNEAVEDSFRRGILTCASLMMAAPACADAVARARRNPGLGVGLHLVLVDGPAVLGPDEIPDLLTPDGRLSKDLAAIGTAIGFRPRVRAQVEAEIRAQLDAFRRTGLPMDHVNGHHHYHIHPMIFGILLRLAPEYGIRAIRVPAEPGWTSWRAIGTGITGRIAGGWFYGLMTGPMKRRLKQAGIAFNDHIFGLNDSGAMDRGRMLAFLRNLPPGVSEIYSHPATGKWSGPEALPDSYRAADEYLALIDPEVIRVLEELNLQKCRFYPQMTQMSTDNLRPSASSADKP